MSTQESKSAMEDMLASIREAIHEETAHQTVGLHAPLRVRAAHEAPSIQPDNDQARDIETPGFLKPLSEDLPETEWTDTGDSENGYSTVSPEKDAAKRNTEEYGYEPETVGEVPFAPRKKLRETGRLSVGGIMSGKMQPPATDTGIQNPADPPRVVDPANPEEAGDAMFGASLPEEPWWPEEDTETEETATEAANAGRTDPQPDPDQEPDTVTPLVSPRTGELAARAFDMLRQELTLPEDLHAMTEEMLRPMLREWLDANLPELVERLVREEITRIAHGASSRRMR